MEQATVADFWYGQRQVLNSQHGAPVGRLDQFGLLQSGGEWLTRALDRGGVGLWRWVSGDRWIALSENIPRMFGYPPSAEPVTLARCFLAIHRDDRRWVKQAFERAIQNRQDIRIECRVSAGDGTIYRVEIVGAVQALEADGYAVEGIVLDITARASVERELVETHAKYQRAIAATGMAVYQLDFRSDEYFNTNLDQLERIVGVRYEGSHRNQWQQIRPLERKFYGELAGLSLAEARRRYESGEVGSWCSEVRIERPDGQLRWLYDVSLPVRDEEGQMVGSFGILQDITEFRRLSSVIEKVVENTAAIEQDYLESLVAALSSSLGVKYAFIAQLVLPEARRFQTIAVAVNGKPGGDFTYDVSETLCEEVWRGGICFYPSGVRERFPDHQILRDLGADAYLGMPIQSSDGETIGLLVVVHDAPIDESVDPVKILRLFAAHAAAAMERRRQEKALESSEEFYRTLFNVLGEGIIVKDGDGIIRKCNAAAQRILRMPEHEIVGKTVDDFAVSIFDPNEDPPGNHRRLTSKQICTGEAQSGSMYGLKHVDGDIRWISINALPIEVDLVSEHRLVVSFSDITAMHEVEEELKKLNVNLESLVVERTRELKIANSELESFAYSVSHDLRQPLRAIDGFARILELDYQDRLDDEAAMHIDKIRKAAKRMSNLIDDLLRLSRLLSQELHLEKIDLTEMATDVFATIQAGHPERNIEFSVRPNLRAVGDERLMMAVFDNLLRNSWKFTSRRKKPSIQVGYEDGVFFIRDNGEGFDMKYYDQLFKPFQRLHSPGEFEGSGIGLATVRRIIERHGGRVWAVSEPSVGTTIFFRLDAN